MVSSILFLPNIRTSRQRVVEPLEAEMAISLRHVALPSLTQQYTNELLKLFAGIHGKAAVYSLLRLLLLEVNSYKRNRIEAHISEVEPDWRTTHDAVECAERVRAILKSFNPGKDESIAASALTAVMLEEEFAEKPANAGFVAHAALNHAL